MKTSRTILSALFILTLSHTVVAQIDASAQIVSIDHSTVQFQYSQFDRIYTLKTDLVQLDGIEEEDLLVYLTVNYGEKIYLVPHHEDGRTLSLNNNLISYTINAENKLDIQLRNPRGGSPWTTLSFLNFSISIELPQKEFAPDNNSLAEQEDQKP